METNRNESRIEEPLGRTLIRNLAIAVVVSTAISLFRHDFRRFLPVAVLALLPSFGGHYIEVAFVNHIRAQLPNDSLTRALVRILVWFGGGVFLYLGMAFTSRVLPIHPLPIGFWWCGGLLFIALELVLHAVLAIRGRSEFYRWSS